MQNPTAIPQQEMIEKAKVMATKAGKKTLSTVKEYPIASAVVAIGAGALIWWLMTRRNAADA